jgi:hypothetical protein
MLHADRSSLSTDIGVEKFSLLFSVSPPVQFQAMADSCRKRMNSNPGPRVCRDCNQTQSDFVFIWKQNLFKASFKLIEFVLFLLEPNNTSAGEALIEFASIATTRRCVMLLMRMSSGLLACNNYD